MNPNKDPVLRRTLVTMNNLIFDKCVNNPRYNEDVRLTETEKRDIDRCTLRYLETSCYVRNTFEYAQAYLLQAYSQYQNQNAEQN